MTGSSVFTAVPYLLKTIRDPKANPLLRVAFSLVLGAFVFGVVGSGLNRYMGLHFGQQLNNISGLTMTTVSFLIFLVIGFIELGAAGKATGEIGILRQTLHILNRVFLYFLLPCILLTALIILWAVVTHQPGVQF